MFGKHKTDVLVVGAGPVGMFTALSPAEQGVGVEIVDAQWRTAARSYALALHPASLDAQCFGVFEFRADRAHNWNHP